MKKILIIVFTIISLYPILLLAQENIVSSDKVVEKDLGIISLDEIGLLSTKESGFTSGMWQGSDAEFISIMLTKLPLQTKSPVISDIKKRLLLSVATKPEGLQGEDVMFFARIRHLANIGDSSSIGNILRKVPENLRNERTDASYIISLFSNQNDTEGCNSVRSQMQKYNNIFWRKVLLACQAKDGKNNELELGLKLLKEDGKELEPAFIEIINGLKGKEAERISAKQNLIKIMNLEFFPEKQIQYPFPRIMNQASTVPGEYMNSWVASMNGISDSGKRIESMGRFYALLESMGEVITVKQWQEIAIYSLANDIKIPNFVWSSLLEDAVSGKRHGEVALIIINAVGVEKLESLSPELLRWLIYAMDAINFKKDAQKIISEAMGIK